jgi:hypothetical protein
MDKDGRVTFKFHQEARNDEMLKTDYEKEHKEKPPRSLTNGYSYVDFNKPLSKCIDWVEPDELLELRDWCYKNFKNKYPNVLADLFACIAA